jgi:hypothetical protein
MSQFLWRIHSSLWNIRKILQYTCENFSFPSKDTAITLLYINFDNNFAMRGTTIHSKPRLIPLMYHTREGTLKMRSQQVLSNFARTGPRDVIAYNYDIYCVLMSDVNSTTSLHPSPAPPHHSSSSSLLLTPPPQKRGPNGTYITTYQHVVFHLSLVVAKQNANLEHVNATKANSNVHRFVSVMRKIVTIQLG